MNNAPTANYALRDDRANLFTCLLTDPAGCKIPPLSESTLKAIENFKYDLTEEILVDIDGRFDHIFNEAVTDVIKDSPRTNSLKWRPLPPSQQPTALFVFQSTPPARGATVTVVDLEDIEEFQSTPPARGATLRR